MDQELFIILVTIVTLMYCGFRFLPEIKRLRWEIKQLKALESARRAEERGESEG
jgi:hypothetical protein